MKLIIIFCICFYVCVSTERNRETNDSNPKLLTNFRIFKACLDNFDIHNDKIIRTEDSRAMGAKYISESDMNTREECLRLCCVTDACDVFVFEEKKSGSCYLFNCGSPADFKCKFTKHHNYTSGVLTLGHRMNVAQEQEKISKHEQELNQLRRPEGASVTSFNFTISAQTQPQEPMQGMYHNVNKTMDQNSPNYPDQGINNNAREDVGETLEGSRTQKIMSLRTDPVRSRQCSRFQFKCRTTGECIAIYNACDGIPQCSDGSDESSDLGCPAPVTSSIIPMAASPRNKTEPDESVLKTYEIPQRNQADKTHTSGKVENIELDIQPAIANMHTDPVNNQPQNRNIQLPVSTSNVLKQHDLSHIPSPEFETLHHPNRFKKPVDSSESNSSPEFSGFRQYLNPHGEVDSEKVEEDVHNYIAAKLMAERNKDIESTDYNQKSQDMNLRSKMKSSFLQKQSDLASLNKHNEHVSLFQETEHDSKLHLSPQIKITQQQQQADLANALRHQLTNVRMSEIQSDVYQNDISDNKETKFPLRNQAESIHTVRLGSQDQNTNKVGSQRELNVETDTEHKLGIEAKDRIQVSFQESPLHDVPNRSYKYEDVNRRIFNHKGYGLVADSDSPEIPYRLTVPNVDYKLNDARSNGFINNIHEYRNQIERSMWAEQIHPTSHVMKVMKNTPQPVDPESGYPIPSDYLYDETQHSILNAVSLIPHNPNSGYHLPPLHSSSVHLGGSLKRPDEELLQGLQNQEVHSHEPANKLMVLNSHIPNVKEHDIPKLKDNGAHDIGRHVNIQPTTVTSLKDETSKHKNEEKHLEHFVSLQQAYISELPNYQQQNRPNGALLSMSFGLCITFVMIVLVACRLRIVKRRLRRNGKSLYAHDADYLVNGMYL